MSPIEIIINILFSSISMLGFFYIYKQTYLNMALLAGTLSYLELAFRTLLGQYPIVIQGLNLLFIPEITIMIYFTILIYKDGNKLLPIMIIAMLIAYILLTMINHSFYGEVGLAFVLICMIWTSETTRTCQVNPWQCKHK